VSALAAMRAYDARGLAELVRTRQVSPAELVQATLEAIASLNPALNAVVAVLADQALACAKEEPRDGPFAGVPLLLKDQSVSLAGVPTGCGSRYFQGWTRPFDNEIVRRYKQAGFIIIGKTNTSELGTSGSCDTVATGAMRNPWDVRRIPGSSSGGSAAAVAAGMVSVAHATDAGGSLRGPAAWCGLVGLKPSRGRNSYAPDAGEHWLGLATQHVVARSVGDSAAILDCTAGPVTGDPYVTPLPPRPFADSVTRDPGRLRIGFAAKSASGPPVDGEILEALQATARLLEQLGHDVDEAAPSWDATLLGEAIMAICATVVAEAVEDRRAVTGIEPSSRVLEKSNLHLWEQGRRLGAMDLLRATRKLNGVSRSFAQFFEHHDIWLTPTMGGMPPPLGYLDSMTDDIDELYRRLWSFFRFNGVYNATGLPAITLPLHQSRDGLPIGMMFGARFGEESLLLQFGGQLERAVPWGARYAAVSIWSEP
jgi:Asp-tRNA(Asn)/Glu-tRNA(Gln) amidotransferase A subunit family amidase